MFDIGSPELIIVVIAAIVFVGPKELPGLIRGFGRVLGWFRNITSEIRTAAYNLASEVEEAKDPFSDLRKKEGVSKEMTPEEITNKIMANREMEASATDGGGDLTDQNATNIPDASPAVDPQLSKKKKSSTNG